MRTTLDLPDDLLREAKVRAARENRRLKEMIAELLRRGLSARSETGEGEVRRRVRLPIVQCVHDATPEEEMTPDRVSDILLADDAAKRRASRR